MELWSPSNPSKLILRSRSKWRSSRLDSRLERMQCLLWHLFDFAGWSGQMRTGFRARSLNQIKNNSVVPNLIGSSRCQPQWVDARCKCCSITSYVNRCKCGHQRTCQHVESPVPKFDCKQSAETSNHSLLLQILSSVTRDHFVYYSCTN